jgi:hypothetical protein
VWTIARITHSPSVKCIGECAPVKPGGWVCFISIAGHLQLLLQKAIKYEALKNLMIIYLLKSFFLFRCIFPLQLCRINAGAPSMLKIKRILARFLYPRKTYFSSQHIK